MIKLITIFIILFMTLTSPKTNNEIDPGFGGIDCGDNPNLNLKWIEKESKDIKYRKEAIFNKFGRSEKYIVIENDNNVYHIAYSRFFAIPFERFNYYIDELYEGIKIENKDQFEEESINEFWNKYEFVIGGIKIRDSYKVYQNSDDLLIDLITEQIENSYQDNDNESIKVFYEIYRSKDYIPLLDITQNRKKDFKSFVDEFIMIDFDNNYIGISSVDSITNQYNDSNEVNAFKIKAWYINKDSNKIICVLTPVKIDNPAYYSTSTVG